MHKRVLLIGATGTIGQATARALVARGHHVVSLVRQRHNADGAVTINSVPQFLPDTELRIADVLRVDSIARDAFRGEQFDAVVSCLASRTGAPADAWKIDHDAHASVLTAAQDAGVPQMVLLSAICVQKPMLAFQQAKLAFEGTLVESGLTYSIVRPTAFFKSLSGQVERVRAGKPFLVFGDGTLTSCKPISDRDTANFLVDCLNDTTLHNRVLPVGGPGAAISPREQGDHLFALFSKKTKFKHVPVAMLDGIIGVLSAAGRVVPALANKAELARIGRYYATESMLVWNSETGRYDASATPSTGSDRLFDYYARLVNGEEVVERGDHAVF